MAEIVIGGMDEFDAAIYGKPHPGTRQFLASQVENLTTNLTEAGQRFMSQAREIYERVSGSEAIRAARAAAMRVRSLWQRDEIRYLATVAQLQNAPLTMQRWVMAQPDIRHLYQHQRADGYSDTYLDVHPGDIGEGHYDYRRVMNGVVVLNEEDEGPEWEATTWFEELLPEDEELFLEEQVDILATWGEVVSALRAGRSDPTSVYDVDL